MIKRRVTTSSRHSGFSLMELLIVLGLLVAVAAIATPSLLSRMRDNAVYESGDAVRAVIAEARRLAIDSGIDYEFRYEPGGQYFIVLPTEVEPANANSLTGDQHTSTYVRLSGQLSDEFSIRALEDSAETQERLGTEQFGSMPEGALLSQKPWSSAVLFRFNGKADDFTFRVSDDDRRTVEISIRGLTGSVRLSQVYQESL